MQNPERCLHAQLKPETLWGANYTGATLPPLLPIQLLFMLLAQATVSPELARQSLTLWPRLQGCAAGVCSSSILTTSCQPTQPVPACTVQARDKAGCPHHQCRLSRDAEDRQDHCAPWISAAYGDHDCLTTSLGKVRQIEQHMTRSGVQIHRSTSSGTLRARRQAVRPQP